jgi:type II secretory pathway pseudopilin PulG
MMRRPAHSHAAFTLVEAAVSMVIVGLMLAASLNAAGVARTRQQRNADRMSGLWLAQALMSEAMDKVYADPGAVPLFGPEAGELQTKRSTLNDVDDYAGLSESPPRNADGSNMTGWTGWSRTVAVTYATSANLNTSSATDSGLKRIVVTVKKGSGTVAQLTGLRAKARDSW